MTPGALVEPVSFFGRSKIIWIVALVILLGLGGWVRFVNLTNPPLDYAASNQLHSASIARNFYYQMLPSTTPANRQMADATGQVNSVEPPIVERIVALTYFLVGGEAVWIARIYSIFFWLVGGLALFDLSQRVTSIDGGLVTLSFYLLLQFAVVVSRSFQPDPFMMMWIILALNSLDHWIQTHSWKWAILTGLLGAMAALTKFTAVFMLGSALIFTGISSWGWRKTFRDIQFWLILGTIGLLPLFYFLAADGVKVIGLVRGWITPNFSILTQVRFYFQWLGRLNRLFDLLMILLASLGAFLLPKRSRWMVLGFWLGYLLYGMLAPQSVIGPVNDNIFLVPVLALSLAPIGSILLAALARQPRFWQVLGVVLAASFLLYWTMLNRNAQLSSDFQQEPVHWKTLGLSLPPGKYIGLTDNSNMNLGYYGMVPVAFWPHVTGTNLDQQTTGSLPGDAESWQRNFDLHIKGYNYFIITLFDELNSQPELKKILEGNYPSTQGDGFIYFDLTHKKQPE
jgi:4-amino-4-deoxy-L-arabinose transferase-like glycosyltransferase